MICNLEELAEILCCQTGSFLITYLGLPLGAKFKSTEIWNGVIEKVEKGFGYMAVAIPINGGQTYTQSQTS